MSFERDLAGLIADLVSEDFSGTGFDVNDIEGTATVSARLTVDLPAGWEFSGYQDSIEVERQISI